MLLKGKRAVVTGGSRGIGRACCVELARQGADIVFNHYDATDDAAAETTAAVEALGRKCTALRGDIGDEAVCEDLADRAVQQLGGLDIMVSNAGICPFHAFLDMPADLWRRVQDTNLTGAFMAVRAAANRMKDQGNGGAIIAVSSISALVGGEFQAHYTTTKAGVHSLMQSIAIPLGRHGIRCNSVMPGAIATDINKDDWSDPKKRAYLEGRVPLGRFGTPEDIARPVAFLASDMAGYINGAALLVDGGLFVNLQ